MPLFAKGEAHPANVVVTSSSEEEKAASARVHLSQEIKRWERALQHEEQKAARRAEEVYARVERVKEKLAAKRAELERFS